MSDDSEEHDDKKTEDPSEMDLSHATPEDGQVIRFILSCRNEAKLAKWNRVQQTRENYDVFWGRHDFSHKITGQSRETLAMQPMAVEQTASFFQQALVDMGNEWWRVDMSNPANEQDAKVKPTTIQAVTQLQLDKANLLRHTGLGLKSGLLGGLIITKVHGCWKDTPKFVADRQKNSRKAKLRKISKKVWQLKFDVVSQFNYFPDPTPGEDKLYEIEDMYMDYKDMCAMAEGPDAIYDKAVTDQVSAGSDDDAEETFDEMRRTNQNNSSRSFRGRVKITEFWGTLLDEDGEVLHENCVATLANDRFLIRKPTPNPLWHQTSPYVTVGLLDSPDATWPKALADSGTKYNIAANELFNLMLDGALRSVNGISQIHQDWLEDPAQVEGGIKPGTNLGVNSQCPPGGKVIEQLMSGAVPADSLQLYNILNQEFNRSMLTSDIRQGMQPRSQVPATQIVEANQTITSVFQGMSKQIEQHWMQKILVKSWQTVAQFSDDMDEAEIRSVLSADDADAFINLTPEERFAETVHGANFDVFGISLSLQKQADVRKGMMLLQTIGGSAPLTEAFVKKYSFEELLNYIMRASGIPVKQLEIPHAEQEMMNGGGAQAQQPQAPGGQDGQMSQVPQPQSGSLQEQLGPAAPAQSVAQTHFSGTGMGQTGLKQ